MLKLLAVLSIGFAALGPAAHARAGDGTEVPFNTWKNPERIEGGYRVWNAGLGYGVSTSAGEKCAKHARLFSARLSPDLHVKVRCVYLPGPRPMRHDYVIWSVVDVSDAAMKLFKARGEATGTLVSDEYESCREFDASMRNNANRQLGGNGYFNFFDYTCIGETPSSTRPGRKAAVIRYHLWAVNADRIVAHAGLKP